MYNRTIYNRTVYNRKARFVFEWTATATAESGSSGVLLVVRRLEGSAEANSEASGQIVRVILLSASAVGDSEAQGDYIRRLFFEAEAIAESSASGTGVSTYGQEVMTIEGVNMEPGDELIIDTEHMTVTLNGVNIIDRVEDSSIFFKLKSGENEIIVEGGTSADIRILWKDRWL